MPRGIDDGRRRFLATTAMTLAAARFGVLGTPDASQGVSRPLTALGRATGWLNSPSLSATQLRGKVVLVQFGTYTCINWLRTLPHMRAWNRKYSQGLTVIGVNTPEFAFEKTIGNVRRAMQQMKIDHPIAIDNDYAIWRAFENQYWPALYLLDGEGRVRHHRFGEGEYERSEMAIQQLRAEAGAGGAQDGVVSVTADGIEAAADWQNLRSPENYLGYGRTANFQSPGGAGRDRRRTYSIPTRLALNHWAVAGEWTMGRHAAVLDSSNGRIAYRFHARDLHLVMVPPNQGSAMRFRVSLDGQPPRTAHGLDVDEAGNGMVVEPRLYQLIRQPGPILERTFDIEFLDAGVEAFAFTFG